MNEMTHDYITIECDGEIVGAIRSMSYAVDKDSVNIDVNSMRLDMPFFKNFHYGYLKPDCQHKPLTFILPTKKINCVWLKTPPHVVYKADDFAIAEDISFEGLAVTDR